MRRVRARKWRGRWTIWRGRAKLEFVNRKTFVSNLRAMTQRNPFSPFVIEFTNGVRLTVTHPEAVIWSGRTAVFFAPNGKLNLFDHQGVARMEDEVATQSSREH